MSFEHLGPRGVCRVCGEPARKKSAFYCLEHAPVKPDRVTTPPRDRKRPAEVPEIIEVIDKATPTRATASAPGQREWGKLLGEIIGYLSVMVAVRMVDHRVEKVGLEQAEAMATDLALSDDEAEKISKPLSRILARSALNKRYGRSIMDNADVLQAFFVLKDFYDRCQPYMAEKREIRKLEQMAQRPSPPPNQGVQPNGFETWQHPSQSQQPPPFGGFGLPNN